MNCLSSKSDFYLKSNISHEIVCREISYLWFFGSGHKFIGAFSLISEISPAEMILKSLCSTKYYLDIPLSVISRVYKWFISVMSAFNELNLFKIEIFGQESFW